MRAKDRETQREHFSAIANEQKTQIELQKEKLRASEEKIKEQQSQIDLLKAQKKKKNRFSQGITGLGSFLYLLASVLLAFGVNILTASPPNQQGYLFIALALLIHIAISVLVIYIQGGND